MIHRLDMDAETRALISHMSPSPKRKIRESLRAIARDPAEGKPLQEELAGLRSYRVGALRIVYSVDSPKRAVHIIAIGPRRTIYSELEKEMAARKRR
jgi:mRNA-degrading endonuclease RelE of RelBE toxin-antitoxin system